MSNAKTPQRHHLPEMRDSDYTDPAAKVNQGIIDHRPEGQEPPKAPVTLDTFVDRDASASPPLVTRASDTLIGATSADVYDGLGRPGQGMSSKELRHDGQPKRKRHGGGVDQFGQGKAGAHGSRKLDGASERRFIAPESEFRGGFREIF